MSASGAQRPRRAAELRDIGAVLDAGNKYVAQPELRTDEPNLRMFAAWFALCEVIRGTTVDWGGGWAGCTEVEIDVYLEMCRQHGILPVELLDAVDDLQSEIAAGLSGAAVHPLQAEAAVDSAQWIISQIDRLNVVER